MLGQYCQGIHNKILLCQPDGASFRNAKRGAYYAHIHMFVWIANFLHTARTGNFRHSRANYLCSGMKRHQHGLSLRHGADIVSDSSGLLEESLKL